MHPVDGTENAKEQLRRRFRTVRRSLPDRAERSARIWTRVEGLSAYRRARCVMGYSSIAGEPDTSTFVARLERLGRRVVVPEDLCLRCLGAEPCSDHDADAAASIELLAAIDLVVVPGLAFSPRGERLGQGGGWYDRFLAGLSTRPVGERAAIVGVCFIEQLVDDLPTEPHDVRMGTVVTETGVFGDETG